jgi:ethanolamine ammonia-lyase large subunit
MAVAGNADPMLGYLTTSFREHPRLRDATGRQPSSAMAGWNRGPASSKSETIARLYAWYHRTGNDSRTTAELEREAARTLSRLRERGWDLGYEDENRGEAPPEMELRLERIYQHARHALYSSIEGSVLQEAARDHLAVRSEARNREDYLMHPHAGERIRPEDAARIRGMYPSRRPTAQVVISDGLNANAISQNLGAVLPALRRHLGDGGVSIGAREIVIENGRVRAGYHVGQLLEVDLVIHLIGERPGTGLNTLSAYLTWGRDQAGGLRWSVGLDHACTTAICGIHPRGKDPESAAREIAWCVQRMLDQRRSGVTLGRSDSRNG